jgi:hypothetical protein
VSGHFFLMRNLTLSERSTLSISLFSFHSSMTGISFPATNVPDCFQDLVTHSPGLGDVVRGNELDILWDYPPKSVIVTTSMASPGSSCERLCVVLIPPHWMRDGLTLMTSVALVAQRVRTSIETNLTHSLGNNDFLIATHLAALSVLWDLSFYQYTAIPSNKRATSRTSCDSELRL